MMRDLCLGTDQLMLPYEGLSFTRGFSPVYLQADRRLTELMGSETFVFLTLGGKRIIARAPADFRAEVASTAWIEIETAKAHLFHPTSGERLAGC